MRIPNCVIGLLFIGCVAAQTGNITLLHSFVGDTKGASPLAGLFRDPAGNLYGTTGSGGNVANGVGYGVVFKLDAAGHETVLHVFSGGTDGEYPNSAVIMDADGNLYGTTLDGGKGFGGVVYKLDTARHLIALHSFYGGADGKQPVGGLTMDSSGNIYGVTQYGGAGMGGLVYKIDRTGNFTVLHSFLGSDGFTPRGRPVLDASGNVYGTTEEGGAAGYGVVYKIDHAGDETVLYGFTSTTDGAYPTAGVILDSAGNLYGTAGYSRISPPLNYGVVYKLDPTGRETVLYTFTDIAGGELPASGVVMDSAGNLYGTAGGGTGSGGVVYKLDITGQETVLHSFGSSSGGYDITDVILDGAGNLYGATEYGGIAEANLGVIYMLNPAGEETVLLTFSEGLEGAFPVSNVAVDRAGNVYGATVFGGSADYGVVYRLDPSGRETWLHNFTGTPDGGGFNRISSGVTIGPDGSIYGTTPSGGAWGQGVVYKIDKQGQETILYSFTGYADGDQPEAGVIFDSSGNIFGTTEYGGNQENIFGCGVVFKLDPAGDETVLHTFVGGASDGCNPIAGLALDSVGNLYGTTEYGGPACSPAGCGVVFRVDPAGQETVVYSYLVGSPTGDHPAPGVTVDAAGNLYGTLGDIFKIDPAGNVTVLYHFTGGADGSGNDTGVILDAAGNLYGSASGGTLGYGLIFKLDPAGNETVLYNFTGATDGAGPGALTLSDGNLYGTASGGQFFGGVVFELEGVAAVK